MTSQNYPNENNEFPQNNLKCIKKSVSNSLNNQTKRDILINQLPDVKSLSRVSKEELGQFISDVQASCPDIKYEHLQSVTEIFIKLKQSKTGYGLFKQLSRRGIEANEILEKWDVLSCKTVLDEIQWRLEIIGELKLIIDNPNLDEVRKLQPLIEKSLWIFGPEYESIEFTSNQTIATAIRKIFNKKRITVENLRLRPDFLVLPDDKSISVYSSNKFDDEGIDKLLLVEIKKADHAITIDDIHQTQNYIQQLIDANIISSDMTVKAYVLGGPVAVDRMSIGANYEFIPMEYHVFLKRAEKRLFNLDSKIRQIKNIDDKPDDDIIQDILNQDTLTEV